MAKMPKNIKQQLKLVKAAKTPGDRAYRLAQVGESIQDNDLDKAARYYYESAEFYEVINNRVQALKNYRMAWELSYWSGRTGTEVVDYLRKTKMMYKYSSGVEWEPTVIIEVIDNLRSSIDDVTDARLLKDSVLRNLLKKAMIIKMDISLELERLSMVLNEPTYSPKQQTTILSDIKRNLRERIMREDARLGNMEQELRTAKVAVEMAEEALVASEHARCQNLASSLVKSVPSLMNEFDSLNMLKEAGECSRILERAKNLEEVSQVEIALAEVDKTHESIKSDVDRVDATHDFKELEKARKRLRRLEASIKHKDSDLNQDDRERLTNEVLKWDKRIKEEMAEIRASIKPKPERSRPQQATTTEGDEASVDRTEVKDTPVSMPVDYPALHVVWDDVIDVHSMIAGGLRLEHGYSIGRNLLIRARITNKSKGTATDISLKAHGHEGFMTILTVRPDVYSLAGDGSSVNIGNIPPGRSQDLCLVGEILNSGNVDLNLTITGRDYRNNPITGSTENVLVELPTPDTGGIIRQEDINIALIKQLMDQELVNKTEYFMPASRDVVNHNELFMAVHQALSEQAPMLKEATRQMEPHYRGEAWFGSLEDPNSRFLINASLDGRNNEMTIKVASDPGYRINDLLNNLTGGIKEALDRILKGRTVSIVNVNVGGGDHDRSIYNRLEINIDTDEEGTKKGSKDEDPPISDGFKPRDLANGGSQH